MNEFAEFLKNVAHSAVKKRAITNHGVLNEPYAYAKPSSFSRGMRIDLDGLAIFSLRRELILFLHQPPFRRDCAGRNSWSRSKPLPCSER
jgi:hypothetical protein